MLMADFGFHYFWRGRFMSGFWFFRGQLILNSFDEFRGFNIPLPQIRYFVKSVVVSLKSLLSSLKAHNSLIRMLAERIALVLYIIDNWLMGRMFLIDHSFGTHSSDWFWTSSLSAKLLCTPLNNMLLWFVDFRHRVWLSLRRPHCYWRNKVHSVSPGWMSACVLAKYWGLF